MESKQAPVYDRDPLRQGFAYRFLKGFYAQRDSAKSHPVWGTLLAVGMLVLGIGANEAYGWARGKIVGPDEYLVQIKQGQEKAFAELQAGLQQLGRSMDGNGRDALRQVRGAVESIEKANTGLLSQLALARQENDRLSKLAGRQSGVAGGYDVILTENSGMRLDAANVLGVSGISSSSASARITSTAADDIANAYLKSGESLPYRGASGKACKVALLSIGQGNPGSASFAVSCG